MSEATSGDGATTPTARWAMLAAYALVAIGVLDIARRRRWLAPGPGLMPGVDRLPWLVGLFFGLIAAQVAGMALATSLVSGGEGEDPIRIQAIGLWAGYLAQVPLAILVVRVLRTVRDSAPRKPTTVAGRAALGLFAFLLVAPLVLATSGIAGEAQSLLRGEDVPAVSHETLRRLVDAPPNAWSVVVMIAVVVVGPILEEAAYRGALQGAFRAAGFKSWTAIVATSLCFVLMHLPSIPTEGLAGALGGLTALSLCLGLVRERSASLVPPIVAHAAFNAANLAVAGVMRPA